MKQLEFIDIETEIENEINQDLISRFTEVAKQRQVGFLKQYYFIADRMWTHVKRNPISINFLIVLAFYNSFLWGSIFYKVAGEKFGKSFAED